MKISIHLLTLILLILFSRCSDQDAHHESSDTSGQHSEHGHGTAEHVNSPDGLALNDGKKWDADDATMSNVAGMQHVVSEFKNNNAGTLEDYVALGNKLQDSVDVMISECRMGGADHEALHLWLEPYMQQVEELGNAAAAPDAESVFHTIETQLSEFNIFFE